MKCPICKKNVSESHFACQSGSKGGAAGRGDAKRRTKAQARKAANARWVKKANKSMPITRTITEQVTRTLTLATLQEYADASIPEEFKQPLKTVEEALKIHGWLDGPMPDNFKPVCCGSEAEISAFIGCPYSVRCKTCGKFVYDVTGPTFGNSYVSLPDSEKVDMETDFAHRWIAGVKPL